MMSTRRSLHHLRKLHFTNHHFTKYVMSSSPRDKEKRGFIQNMEQSMEDEIDEIDINENTSKTLISDIILKYNKEYSSSANDSIISAAQSIPDFKHLYIVQLINPFNTSARINIIGIKQESITEQDSVAIEIKKLLHLIKPSSLIVQLSKDRYETHMNNLDINDTDTLLPSTYSLTSLLSQSHLTQSARIGLHLINYLTMNGKIRMNPYLFALLYANDEKNGCEFIQNIILGDMPYSEDVIAKNNESMFANRHKYIASTTWRQRRKYGSYPGISELLFGINSVNGVYEWINLNKQSIKLREKDVYQFAIDMQQKLEFGKDILEISAKSMAYYTYKYAERNYAENGENNDNILVLCNIFTMLSMPMHFGKVTNAEINALKKKKPEDRSVNMGIYKKWIFNYWNGVWWSLCFMHTAFQTGFDNLDLPYLLQFGVVFPIMYPTFYMAVSFRARYRVRKLQQILVRSQKQQMRDSKIHFDSTQTEV